MMRSMPSEFRIKIHQTKMDVIGNNIANVNTTGFKAGRVTFNEVLAKLFKEPVELASRQEEVEETNVFD